MIDPQTQARANAVFWTTFVVMVVVPAAVVVVPQVGRDPFEQVVTLAFGAVASLVVPAGLIALIVSRPVRVHGAHGPLLTSLIAVPGLLCGVAAAVWWAAHPPAEVGWLLTGALWREMSWASLILLPILMLTIVIDVGIQIVWAVAKALAPALVPAFGVLAGVFGAWMLVALVMRILTRLRARRA